MAEETLDLEGECMKAIWSGFWRGFVTASMLFGLIGIFVGAIWLLTIIGEWLTSVYGEIAAIIILIGLIILGTGIFQGFWVYKHYRRYKKRIKKLETERMANPDPRCDYDFEICFIERRIKELLSGDYTKVW